MAAAQPDGRQQHREYRGKRTTVIARIGLDMLRSRRSKREDSLELTIPDFLVSRDEGPEGEVVMADSVGLALLVVLDSLTPAERLAFVLHDMFALPFEEIARSWVDRLQPLDNSPAVPVDACKAPRCRI